MLFLTFISPFQKLQKDRVSPLEQSHKAMLLRVFWTIKNHCDMINNLQNTIVLHNNVTFSHPKINTI